MIVRSIKLYVTLIFSMFSMLCVADGRRDDLIQIDFADSVNHAYLDIDNEGDTIYVWLMKSTSEIDDVVVDSLCLNNQEYADDREGIEFVELRGQLNDTTELVELQSKFDGTHHYDHGWKRYAIFLVAVSPHGMQLIRNHDLYAETRYAENANANLSDEDWNWKYGYENYSYSISNRKNNGFYEIDVKKVTEEGDNDDNRHVTSSSSRVLYYDGEKFVEREVKTVE